MLFVLLLRARVLDVRVPPALSFDPCLKTLLSGERDTPTNSKPESEKLAVCAFLKFKERSLLAGE